ncbi:GMC family oxidoreductase [Salmonella enterica]|nr:GMC family oxidoreductase [Salmonella enterica]EAA9598368.1 GMC family oxidoreductase [Salmonella enterica]EAO9641169.1 GMC family oxidoreductase [Salmonella enterica]EKI3326952.1 GMC family oxidoreductase [Salmonella enterica]
MNNNEIASHYNYIVVGGGTSGCIMASRLSENEHKSVLLLESGPRSNAADSNSPLNDASRLVLENYNWQYIANVHGTDQYSQFLENKISSTPTLDRRKPFSYRLGKVIGGSSAINGAVALRALPDDFSNWTSMGCSGWTWQDAIPWYCKMENDCDIKASKLHGQSGPLLLHRPKPQDILPIEKAFADVCINKGTPWVEDLNNGVAHAVGVVPSNVLQNAERFDFYRAYLMPATKRFNLKIRTECTVNRVIFFHGCAIGVEIEDNGKQHVIKADRVILCAGAIGSAILLQRSGVGDSRLLNRLNIPVILDNPAIGNNLSDHATVVMWALPKPNNSKVKTPWRQTAARLSSGFDSRVDVLLGLMNNVASSTVPGFSNRIEYPALVGASVMLMRPIAKGRVFIRSSDYTALPTIYLPLSHNDEDIQRLTGGVRKMWQIINSKEISRYIEGIQFWRNSMIENDKVMHSAIRNLISPGWHPSGTIRMGNPSDVTTAADEKGNVHGLENLTVADASLFPCIPSMPTNLTTAMIAERIAAYLMENNND